MTSDDSPRARADLFRRCYSRLVSLRDEVRGEGGWVKRRYIDDYHDAVGQIETLGYSLDDFKFPSHLMSNRTFHSEQHECLELEFWRTRLAGIIRYFELNNEPMPRPARPRAADSTDD